MDKILLVIVLYKIKLEDSISFITLSSSLKELNRSADLVVYDNSPEKPKQNQAEIFKYWNITYIHDPTNPGISKAYNEAYHIGIKQNKEWLLVADQDTHFPKDALKIYLKSIGSYPSIYLFAPILKSETYNVSPTWYFFKRGFPKKKINPGLVNLNYISPVNSGLLINMYAFAKTGGYNEKVKLDFSDYQFIERFKTHFKQFVILDITCKHGISTMDDSTIESSLSRYNFYCEGAYHSAKNVKDRFIYIFITFLRGLNLTKKFKTLEFLKAHFNFWNEKW